MRIEVMITTKDRWSELALCLESLRHQTIQDFDIILLDDQSGTPITNCYFLGRLVNQLKLEGHRVMVLRNEVSRGVCEARNLLQKTFLERSSATHGARIDDDVVLAPDYLEKLMKVIESGYDIASGITPLIGVPMTKRETRFVKPIINRHELDNEGNLILRNDDCGFDYFEEDIIPTHQFRSCALMKREVIEKIEYPTTLTFVGFREELWYSFRAIMAGFKIGVHTGARALHFQTPSGGTRSNEYAQNVQLDEDTTNKWVKRRYDQKGDFLR